MKKKPAKAKKSVKPKKKVVKAKKRTALGKEHYAQSKRLAFRLIEAGDEALYCGLFTDAKTMEYVTAPLSPERAAHSFRRAVEVSQQKPWTQRITVIVEKPSKKPIGIASIKMVDADKRIAEVGILLKHNAQSQRHAVEASTALINSAFRRHTIDAVTAQVTHGHKTGERLVKSIGYTRGEDLAATENRAARSSWSIGRETWADTFK